MAIMKNYKPNVSLLLLEAGQPLYEGVLLDALSKRTVWIDLVKELIHRGCDV